MPEFLDLLPPPQALARLLEHLPERPKAAPEPAATESALGRVLALPVRAPHPLPAFPRSTVDGYAVRAADTYGASEGLPAYLAIVGEVPMGGSPAFSLGIGQAAVIHTGGMLPAEGDAVVMLEHTQGVRPGEIEVLRPAALGENVLRAGEDVAEGEVVLAAGKQLRPAELGGLMALGLTEIQVVPRPRVAILSSGDEVVPPRSQPRLGQVRDVNTYTLSGLVRQAGGEPVPYGIIPDQADAMYAAARQAQAECEMVVITAGSSASARDLTAGVVSRLGAPGVLVHGVNVRPGKPTILAVCAGKPIIGLPGNPVSALVIAGLFVVPVIERLLGLEKPQVRASVQARLALNIPSQAGREDWIPVRLAPDGSGWAAEPVFGKSNLIFTLSRADGLVRIPPDATGLSAGESVLVYLF